MLYTYKPSLTVEEQVEYIEKNKRVVFNEISKEKAMEILYIHNYINVVSPFKFIGIKWETREDNGIRKPYAKKDEHGKHIYDRDIEFKELYDKYLEERSSYPIIFKNICEFETLFNAIVSYHIFNNQIINDSSELTMFFARLRLIVAQKNPYPTKQVHHLNNLDELIKQANTCDNCYNFFDRLSLGDLLMIYTLLEEENKIEIFNEMKRRNPLVNQNNYSQMEDQIFRMVAIRNCVYHANSLKILTLYYNLKRDDFRTKRDKESFENLIEKLIENYNENQEKSHP
jgi:Abi-like protein.